MGTEVMVAGGEGRVGVSVGRSLARRGLKVAIVSVSSFGPALHSKFFYKKFVVPSPAESISAYCERILKILEEGRYEVIFPLSDLHLIPILSQWIKFEKYAKIASPPPSVVDLTLDKWKTLEIAKKSEIPIPASFIWQDEDGLREISRKLNYPVIIKPRRSYQLKKDRLVQTGYLTFANSPEELIQKGASLKESLVQELVQGDGYGFFALLKDGKVRAKFAHHRLHEVRVTGGASSLRESTVNRKVESLGTHLLETMNWDGVAMVEFKHDQSTDQYRLMEVNGRFWGSLQLAIFSGVDFPALYYQMLSQGDIPPQPRYKTDVLCRWMPGEVSYLLDALNLIRKSEEKRLVLNRKAGNRFEVLKDFILLFFDKRVKYDLFTCSDPLPSLFDFIAQAKKLL
jgi:predicted ATP-grasp superfamily ATP-dependent carboligase